MQIGTAAAIAIGASVATGAAIGTTAGLASAPRTTGSLTRDEGAIISGTTVAGGLVGAGLGAFFQSDGWQPWNNTSMKKAAGIGAAMLGAGLLAGTLAHSLTS